MTPLPDFLFDTYKRYKADTDRVAAWLVETAQKCGHTLESQVTSRPSGPRLKGKARKEARMAGTAAGGLRHTVTVKGLADLAQSIANQKPQIKVPKLILLLLKSAITLRRRCADWFQKNATGQELPESLDKHSHFIGVLEVVLQILEPNSAPENTDLAQERGAQSKSTAQIETDTQSRAEQTNPYDILYFEEDALEGSIAVQDTTAVLNVARRQITPSPPRNVTYEINPTDEEVYFAIYCFFDDLNRLRDFLRDLWSDYKASRADLITVSVTTNTAIDLVHRAEQDFVAAFPKLDTYDKITGVFYLLMCHIRGENAETREQPMDVVNHAMLDVADWLYLPVNSLLLSFCDVVQPNYAPVMKPGHFGVYNPHADRSKLTVREQLQEDRIILLEALPEFFIITKINGNLPVADELTNGLRSMFVQKTVPLWVTYAAQIFLDIHHVLRADVVRGLSELRASGTHAASTLKEYFATSKTFENWPAQNEEVVRRINKFVDSWIVQDAFGTAKRKLYRSVVLPPDEPFSLFSRHPLLCGLFQFRLYLLLQDGGISLTTAWGSILYVAHLYEACRQGGYLQQIWPDMEMIMDIHTREQIFSGRVPQTAKESLKCMSLMLGASSSEFCTGHPLGRRPSKAVEEGTEGIDFQLPCDRCVS